MKFIYAFLIKDAEEDVMSGVTLATNDSLDFNDIKRMLERVVRAEELQDKFYLSMASEETTYDVIAVGDVPIGRFTFHEVTRRDWAIDVPSVLSIQNSDCVITQFTPEALASVIANTMGVMELDDVGGDLRGIPYKQL